ncbi:MAG: HIT domain-containing protein [Kiritimatiellae bacterium]|nr:HIT domain-containing protein [Kiritimatiellia bacterium]
MKNLWAPWRMDFIRSPKTDGCFMCDAIAGSDDRDTLLLHRAPIGVVIMNRYPYTNGHLLVAPRRHVADLRSLTDDERLELMKLTDDSVRALGAVARPEGYNIGINLGRVAGAGLESHLHIHIVPRWNGDTNFMPVFGEVRVIPQALEELYDQLKPQFG